MNKKKTVFTEQEKEFYLRDIHYFISKLHEKQVIFSSNHAIINANYSLNLNELNFSFLNQQQNEKLKIEFQKYLYQIFEELEFFNPDTFELTLQDYINYINKNKEIKYEILQTKQYTQTISTFKKN